MDLVRVMVYFASMGMGNLALLSCAVNPTTQLLTHNALVDFTRYGEIEGLVKHKQLSAFVPVQLHKTPHADDLQWIGAGSS